jgi:5,10-methylenetetrahydromethanopterin reductase
MFELWRAGGSNTTTSAEVAKAVEAEGWDGQMFMDSQSLSADPYVQMGAWAMATERLKLSTGVTNPYTRHVAVTAASVATLQAISDGRAVCGIGRGDSALAYLGLQPARLSVFERYLADLQTLLSHGEIGFGERTDDAQSLDSMSLGARPDTTQLRWLSPDLPKVPLDVAATGPKVIEMAARIAEQVTFSVGAIVERLEWARDLADQARAKAGLAGRASYGAQIIVVCTTDPEAGIEMAMRSCAPLARFQVIQGKAAGPASDIDAQNFAAIRKGYDMTKHSSLTDSKKIIGEQITPDFARRFAVVGGPEHCYERLLELAGTGLERMVVVGPGFYPESWGDKRHLFVREVMPALRKAFAESGHRQAVPA